MMILFWIMMFIVFGGLIRLSVRLMWGAAKVLLFLVLLPGALIALACGGLLVLAFPILLAVGVGSLLRIAG